MPDKEPWLNPTRAGIYCHRSRGVFPPRQIQLAGCRRLFMAIQMYIEAMPTPQTGVLSILFAFGLRRLNKLPMTMSPAPAAVNASIASEYNR